MHQVFFYISDVCKHNKITNSSDRVFSFYPSWAGSWWSYLFIIPEAGEEQCTAHDRISRVFISKTREGEQPHIPPLMLMNVDF